MDCFFVTTSRVVEKQWERFGRVYIVDDANRKHPIKVLKVLARCAQITLRERPSVVISTGAAAGCLMAFLGKLVGARVAWVESIANTERLSLSGRLVRPIADLMLTQWQEVARRYKSVEYVGQVI